jgi:Sin3 family co-repressor/C-terminal domain of Sin3a protein
MHTCTSRTVLTHQLTLHRLYYTLNTLVFTITDGGQQQQQQQQQQHQYQQQHYHQQQQQQQYGSRDQRYDYFDAGAQGKRKRVVGSLGYDAEARMRQAQLNKQAQRKKERENPKINNEGYFDRSDVADLYGVADGNNDENAKQPLVSHYDVASEKLFMRYAQNALPKELWKELLKLMAFYAKGVANATELMHVAKDLFNTAHKRDAAILYDAFQGILALRSAANLEGCNAHFATGFNDIDLAAQRTCTPSYRALPSAKQMPVPVCSARSPEEAAVLNDRWASYPIENDSGNGVFRHMRRNTCEETLFKIEDERFELDMVIESTASARARLEPVAQEIAVLKLVKSRYNASAATAGAGAATAGGDTMDTSDNENDSDDSSSNSSSSKKRKSDTNSCYIAFKMPENTLSCIQKIAISRLYGEHGSEVLKMLEVNPVTTVPLVIQRLQQKETEWRAARDRMKLTWRESVLKNDIHKALDHRSYYFKLADKQHCSRQHMLADVKGRYMAELSPAGLAAVNAAIQQQTAASKAAAAAAAQAAAAAAAAAAQAAAAAAEAKKAAEAAAAAAAAAPPAPSKNIRYSRPRTRTGAFMSAKHEEPEEDVIEAVQNEIDEEDNAVVAGLITGATAAERKAQRLKLRAERVHAETHAPYYMFAAARKEFPKDVPAAALNTAHTDAYKMVELVLHRAAANLKSMLNSTEKVTAASTAAAVEAAAAAGSSAGTADAAKAAAEAKKAAEAAAADRVLALNLTVNSGTVDKAKMLLAKLLNRLYSSYYDDSRQEVSVSAIENAKLGTTNNPTALKHDVEAAGYTRERPVLLSEDMFVFVRLHAVLVQRLIDAMQLCASVAAKGTVLTVNAAQALNDGNPLLEALLEHDVDSVRDYGAFVAAVTARLHGTITADAYEDSVRRILGNEGWSFSTMDNLVSAVVTYLLTAANDPVTDGLMQLAAIDKDAMSMKAKPRAYNAARAAVAALKPHLCQAKYMFSDRVLLLQYLQDADVGEDHEEESDDETAETETATNETAATDAAKAGSSKDSGSNSGSSMDVDETAALTAAAAAETASSAAVEAAAVAAVAAAATAPLAAAGGGSNGSNSSDDDQMMIEEVDDDNDRNVQLAAAAAAAAKMGSNSNNNKSSSDAAK